MKHLLMAAGCTLFISLANAQNDEDRTKAGDLTMKAIEMMDNGRIDESIEVLERASELAPTMSVIQYEIAYAYQLKKDYKSAIKTIKKVIKADDASAQYYQLLGNCYDYRGKARKAIKTYEKGLKRFPNAGRLYLERGTMAALDDDYSTAMTYWEEGIFRDPTYPSNYYWASNIYLQTSEEIWGMLYGEVFMNIERNTNRTQTISKLMYDTYRSEITFQGDTSAQVSFVQNAVIYLDKDFSLEDFKLPYSTSVYEVNMTLAATPFVGEVDSLSLEDMHVLRENFVNLYYENDHDEEYPNIVFEFRKQVEEAGHLKAYNYWLLSQGELETFKTWMTDNQEDWDAFVEWFSENPMEITDENKFYRGKYE